MFLTFSASAAAGPLPVRTSVRTKACVKMHARGMLLAYYDFFCIGTAMILESAADPLVQPASY